MDYLKINDIEKDPESMDSKELKKLIDKVEKRMQKAAKGVEKAPGKKERAKSTGKKEEKP